MLSLICNTWGNQLKQKVIYRNVGKIQIYRFSDQTNFRQSINRMFYCDVYLNLSNPVKRKETSVLRLTQLRRFFVNKSWGEEVSNLKFKLNGSECFKNTKRNIVVTIPLLNTVYGWCLMPWVKNVCKEWKKTNIWKMFCFFFISKYLMLLLWNRTLRSPVIWRSLLRLTPQVSQQRVQFEASEVG